MLEFYEGKFFSSTKINYIKKYKILEIQKSPKIHLKYIDRRIEEFVRYSNEYDTISIK